MNRSNLLVLLSFLSACGSVPIEPTPRDTSKALILDVRPMAGPPKESPRPQYVPIEYESSVGGGVTFTVTVKELAAALVLYPHRKTADDHICLNAVGEYKIESEYVPPSGGCPGKVKLNVTKPDGSKESLYNHDTLAPAIAGQPMQRPGVHLIKAVPEKTGARTWIAIDHDVLGILSGFTLEGMNLRATPDWLNPQADLAGLSPATGCVVDPRPKPSQPPPPPPGEGVHAAEATEYEYLTIEYFSKGPSKNGSAYEIDLDILVPGSSAVYLAELDDLEPSDPVQLAPGKASVSITYNWRWTISNQVVLKVGNRTLRTGIRGLRDDGQFTAPRVAPMGLTLLNGKQVEVCSVTMTAFGRTSGFLLLGDGLVARPRHR